MLFVEAKRLYNDALTFMQSHNINDYDSNTRLVHVLDKDRQTATHEIQYLSSQMRQSVIARIKHSLHCIGHQEFKKRLRVEGAEQFITEDGVELANAKLLNLPDGYLKHLEQRDVNSMNIKLQ